MTNAGSNRKRLVGERFRRVWAVVEKIASHPGHSRAELARHFHLSERQLQSDLNIIRHDMRLPLVRQQGYRFVSEGGVTSVAGGLTIHEAQLLVLLVQQARRYRTVPNERVEALAEKVPELLPPHIQPLMARLIDAGARPGREQQVFTALTDAALRGTWVRLHYPHGSGPLDGVDEPEVQPELLLPYQAGWYVLGQWRHGERTRMWSLDGVIAVTLAAPEVSPADRRENMRGAGY